jgi:hypothetical protein
VIEDCRGRGYEITARQLERWRPLLPGRIAGHEQGLRGSRSVNSPGYADQVIAIAETLQSGIPLREMPLALFLRGFTVELEALRAAYLDILTRLQQEMDTFTARIGAGEDEPADQLDAAAAHMAAHARRSVAGRRWQARARQATLRHNRHRYADLCIENFSHVLLTGMAHVVAAATGKDQESEEVHTLRS